MKLDNLPEILSSHSSYADRKVIDLIVLHSTEGHERTGSARSSASWLASPKAGASAHYFVDDKEIIRGLPDGVIGWHAPGVNSRSIGVEHAGKAAQTEADWADDYSRAVIRNGVNVVAAICAKWCIPPVLVLSPAAGVRGITTHAAVSRAYKKSTHTDPGPGFPLIEYIRRVGVVLSTGVDEV